LSPRQKLIIIALELGLRRPHLQRPVGQAVGLAVAQSTLGPQLLEVGPQVGLEELDAALMPLRLGRQVLLQALNLALDELSAPLNLSLVPGDPAQRPVCGAVVRDAPGLVAGRDVRSRSLVNLVQDVDVLKWSYHLLRPPSRPAPPSSNQGKRDRKGGSAPRRLAGAPQTAVCKPRRCRQRIWRCGCRRA